MWYRIQIWFLHFTTYDFDISKFFNIRFRKLSTYDFTTYDFDICLHTILAIVYIRFSYIRFWDFTTYDFDISKFFNIRFWKLTTYDFPTYDFNICLHTILTFRNFLNTILIFLNYLNTISTIVYIRFDYIRFWHLSTYDFDISKFF